MNQIFTIGLPLALNMLENGPFWKTVFSNLGYRVIYSPVSDNKTYAKALDTVPSGTICYPAKLLHGHVMSLIEQEVDIIWTPIIKWEMPERKQSNHYNCPVVAFYPETVKNNLPALKNSKTKMYTPPLPYDNKDALAKHLKQIDFLADFSLSELRTAIKAGTTEDRTIKTAIQSSGEYVLKWIDSNNSHGFVLAGHPYHIDPEINHRISRLITSQGYAVLTEDSIAHLAPEGELRVSDQWVYHRRLYDAARVVAQNPRLDLIQLVSFGCGLDAVTSDMVRDILEDSGKIYTQLKIDEMSATRPFNLRIRSLLHALRKLGAL